jgi:hypothetical protein
MPLINLIVVVGNKMSGPGREMEKRQVEIEIEEVKGKE